jgi:hypothetical protein
MGFLDNVGGFSAGDGIARAAGNGDKTASDAWNTAFEDAKASANVGTAVRDGGESAGVMAFPLLLALSSDAQSQCDCSQNLGECIVTPKYDDKENEISFSSATKQCANFTYYVDGEPKPFTIIHGHGSVEYLRTDPNHKPDVSTDHCTICKTNE